MRIFFLIFISIALIISTIVNFKIIHLEYSSFSEQVLEITKKTLGMRRIPRIGKKRFNQDCIGYCCYIYFQAGVDLLANKDETNNNLTENIISKLKNKGYCYNNGLPTVGDLVIFDNTYDFNRNGKWDDPYTHIGIVTHIETDNTIEFYHYTRGLAKKGYLNFGFPTTNKTNDRIVNTYLRSRWYPPKPLTNYLSVNLFREFVRIRPELEKLFSRE